jgi:hypothetical protein
MTGDTDSINRVTETIIGCRFRVLNTLWNRVSRECLSECACFQAVRAPGLLGATKFQWF